MPNKKMFFVFAAVIYKFIETCILILFKPIVNIDIVIGDITSYHIVTWLFIIHLVETMTLQE